VREPVKKGRLADARRASDEDVGAAVRARDCSSQLLGSIDEQDLIERSIDEGTARQVHDLHHFQLALLDDPWLAISAFSGSSNIAYCN